MRVRIQPIGNVVAASLDVAKRRDVHHRHARGRAGHRPRRAGQVRRVAGGAAVERRQAVRVVLARHPHHQVLVLDRPLHGREGGDQAPAGWRARPHDRVVRRRVAGPELFSAPAGGPPPLDLEHRRASLVGGGVDGVVSRPAAVRMSSNEQPCDHAIHGGPPSGRDPIQTRSVPPQHGHGPVMPSPARVVVGWNPARREAATIVAPVQGVMRGAPSCGAVSPRAARDSAGVRRVQPLLGLRSTPTGRRRHPERLSGHAGSRRVCPRVWGDRAGCRPRCGVLRGVVVAGLAAARARRRPAAPYGPWCDEWSRPRLFPAPAGDEAAHRAAPGLVRDRDLLGRGTSR